MPVTGPRRRWWTPEARAILARRTLVKKTDKGRPSRLISYLREEGGGSSIPLGVKLLCSKVLEAP